MDFIGLLVTKHCCGSAWLNGKERKGKFVINILILYIHYHLRCRNSIGNKLLMDFIGLLNTTLCCGLVWLNEKKMKRKIYYTNLEFWKKKVCSFIIMSLITEKMYKRSYILLFQRLKDKMVVFRNHYFLNKTYFLYF